MPFEVPRLRELRTRTDLAPYKIELRPGSLRVGYVYTAQRCATLESLAEQLDSADVNWEPDKGEGDNHSL